jgi:hypothetical protein
VQATLGALEFIGDGDAATYTIGRNGLVGYFEGVDTQGEQLNRAGGDGAFDSPLFLTGRLITLSGMILASSAADFEAALTALATISTQTLSTFTVTSDAGTTTAQVRRVGKPDISVNTFGLSGAYQLTLFAPDPRRYGSAQPTAGPGASLSVSHDGNWPATPRVTVTGAQSAPYTVSDGTHSVTVTQALASGHTHVIDMNTGWVYLDGVVQPNATSALDVFQIPPATTVTVTGPPSMSVDVTDTYV